MKKAIRTIIENSVGTAITNHTYRIYAILSVGAATFFFGFAAGALVNLYLIWIGSPLVTQFRTILMYKSAIFGDGIILPVVNMLAASFLIRHQEFVHKKTVRLALFLGMLVTIYFHVNQAVNKIVNWTMPEPWHWNFLGIWHAVYMFAVATLLCLFYIILFRLAKRDKYLPKEAVLVTVGIIIFFVLLRMDYITIDFFSFRFFVLDRI